MPFNWANPIGYWVAVCLECILMTYFCFIAMTLVSICISSYLFEMSLAEDLKKILNSIDDNSGRRKNLQNPYTQFSEFVDIHSATKQLS